MLYINFKPLYILQRLLFILYIFIWASCTTALNTGLNQESVIGMNDSSSGFPDKNGIIIFNNKTPFIVHLVRGSGRVDVGTILPFGSLSVNNLYDSTENYFPLFDIPITGTWTLIHLRSDSIDYYFRIDNSLEYQEIDIVPPNFFDENRAFIIFSNNSRSGGVSVMLNDSNYRMTGLNFTPAKDNVNVGETIVYQINPRDIQYLLINPLNITFGELNYQNGYVYKFIFDGSNVNLIDARPLAEIGAKAPLAVRFDVQDISNSGYQLSEANKRSVIQTLRSEFENYGIPLQPLFPEEETLYENRIFFSLNVSFNMQYLMTYQGNVSLFLLLNGNIIKTSTRRAIAAVTSQERIITQIENYIKGLSDFYTDMVSDIGL